MDKKLKPVPPVGTFKQIPGTSYVVINDQFVAKLLTPMEIGVNNQVNFNLFLDKKCRRLPLTKIIELAGSSAPTK